jgi:DNA-binding response OmpR family regulator
MIATTSEPAGSSTIKVLIIENDNDAGQALVNGLKESNMTIAWAMSGTAGIALQKIFSPDVLLLDLNLPDQTGIDLVNYVAQQGECGIIIVSDVADVAERIVALDLGADDYVPKPPPVR